MRLLVAAWWLQFRLLSRSPFFLGMSLMTPLAYGGVTLLMSGGEASLRAILGAGLLGAWSATMFGAAEALFMQRFAGTLEFLIGAPRSLVAPVFGFTAATVTLGVYSLAAVSVMAIAFARLGPIAISDPWGLIAALIAVLVSLVSMGTLLAGLYVLTRHAIEITNVMEYPIWLACGLVVPSAALWPPLSAAGHLFPLGWGMDALDGAISGSGAWGAAAAAVALAAMYGVAGILFLYRVDVLARRRGTLRLR
ncbi:ABC transporter permease [Leifsonia sp. fls2-241-R2A-40a]|uniref:ABC transporter permease n=1 Tax=Leifsonia sp. fls2-241-R2A-40a TaxID=3040290 RepID=UPI00254B81C2|nr:ABC transporter permease [Leifsonia sp. fls2-241-R2A-40a]